MEGNLIKINEWLLPLSWLYGVGSDFRNMLFNTGILSSKSYSIPIISVGNITAGGTGKTPHIEYLIRLLSERYRVAVLSRGYKRRSRGYVLAQPDTPMEMIGDEPWQIKEKFPQAYVAVDTNRRHGIERLMTDQKTRDVQVILLDDAYQHRYVTPGINILLIDYHRMITEDRLLPAGRLRERVSSKIRANMVIVTKCPRNLTPIGYRVVQQSLHLKPYQSLFFSTFKYGNLRKLFTKGEMPLEQIRKDSMHVLLVTGIGNPQQMEQDMRKFAQYVTPLSYSDHHYFTPQNVEEINNAALKMPKPMIVVTTEKDAPRLKNMQGFNEVVRDNLYVFPIEIEILKEKETTLNEQIINYVHKNS
ncbi:MAG: tetraacyldisaccharide 4'-kinase [Bacteroidaceae bacterium]|nr:tetraacyldisaccharide 4'-kinase [Bacteroidaceae bacterium]MBR1901360.1 tetraacyldisaccharide 4'-kinase [Bacteroidaceae bacterium]